MALTLCPNCRLPVNENSELCHFCTTEIRGNTLSRGVPVAAAIALIATVAVFARRRLA